MANRYFPKDCLQNCPHYTCYDLSIDDYTNICSKLNLQVDDCDAYGPMYIPRFCPLSDEEFNELKGDSE